MAGRVLVSRSGVGRGNRTGLRPLFSFFLQKNEVCVFRSSFRSRWCGPVGQSGKVILDGKIMFSLTHGHNRSSHILPPFGNIRCFSFVK
jgi:hypothetical protein